MKKIFSVLLLILVLICIPSCNSQEKPELMAFNPENDDNPRSIADLCKGQKYVSVGFIGGSVTEGRTYTSAFMEYLRETYPDNVFTEVNAGIGGTTSLFGVHRLYDQILCYDPDIIFVEFSVNDDVSSLDLYKQSMEGIIRKILRNDAGVLVALLGSTNTTYIPYYDSETVPEIVAAHMEVAEYYNIPYVNMGKELSLHISNSDDPWDHYFIDGVHPNQNGGDFYADVMVEQLSEYVFNSDYKEVPLTENVFENSAMFDARDFDNDSWEVLTNENLEKYPTYRYFIFSQEVGATLEFDFCGTMLGAYCRFDDNSGDLEYSIDGGEWKKCSLYSDFYTINKKRLVGFVTIESGLKNTKHHVVMRISEDRNDRSTGHTIRIGAFAFSK